MPDLQGYNYAYQTVCTGKVLKADAAIKPDYLRELINRMLLLDPSKRPDSNEIFARLSGGKLTDNVSVRVIVQPRDEEAGIAFVNNKQDIYVAKGTEVTFAACPNAGYQFEYWKVGSRTEKEVVWEADAEKDMVAIAYFKRAVPENGEWPIVEVLKENPNRVRVTFEDGRKRILDKIIAETMGWKC